MRWYYFTFSFSFRSPLDSHRNVSSSLTSCQYILLIYWPRITLHSHFSLRILLILLLCVEHLPFVSLFLLNWFKSSANFAVTLSIELKFGWLLLWLLIFKNWSSIYFVFKYSAVLITSALYMASVCNRPLLPSFLFTYSLSISAFGRCILYNVSNFFFFSFPFNFSYFF